MLNYFTDELIETFSEKYFLYLILSILCVIMMEGVFGIAVLIYIATWV